MDDDLFFAWQMTALTSCILAGGAMIVFFYKYPSTRAHPGPVLLCIFLSTCVANITRVALHTWHLTSKGENGQRLNPATLGDIANHELLGSMTGVETNYIPFFFWCEFFFVTSATMWYLMLALDLIFSLSNPFLPFNADNLKHHVYAWPAALLWCIAFRYLFENNNRSSRSQHILLYFHLPAYIVFVYMTVALGIAWRKSRRLETQAHRTTRRMAKLILPYLAVFVGGTLVMFVLYLFQLAQTDGRETSTANAIDQLALVLETLAVFVLFCRDAGVFRALSHKRTDKNLLPVNNTMGVPELGHGGEKIDVSNKLRMDVVKYMCMGIERSSLLRIQAAEREEGQSSDITFPDYAKVESMAVVVHGKKTSIALNFRDCAPKVFHHIRELFHIDEQFYMDSFDPAKILSEHGSEGKSGNIFYFTSNKQFMVKSVPKDEFDTLCAILPHYHRYLLSNPETMLCRYFGCHSISLPVGKRRMYFVVMQNLFNDNGPIFQRFDLKGNCDRRQAINASQVELTIQLARDQQRISQLMMDIDFHKFNGGISLARASASRLQGQLCDDIVFLASRGIIDYSILLGIRYLKSDESLPPQSHGIYSHDGQKVYYLGTVDMLQRYNWKWTVQRWFLGLLLCKDTHDVSAVPPEAYGTRLTKFVKERLFDVHPDTGGASSHHSRRSARLNGMNGGSDAATLIVHDERDYVDENDNPIRFSSELRDYSLSSSSIDSGSMYQQHGPPSSPSVAYTSVRESPHSTQAPIGMSEGRSTTTQQYRKPSFFV
uniref:PIPK domain-containing protein n=1 Tax=Globisporangium ultimum (strain ATCC 200006 / CBS 805.95 / DAOM BR144) TaxID=431595 RepID=K3WWS8_GLOUD